MKYSSIISAVIGGAFFAVPYVALSVGLAPSLLIGAAAYGAGELLFYSKNNKNLKENNRSLYDTIQNAKSSNKEILAMASKVDKGQLKEDIKEIHKSISNMISTVEENPQKAKNMGNFFDYYLPVTLSILKKYDEIENQELSTQEGRDFLRQTEDMISKINAAFKNQLSSLYQSDMVDTDAEMKVFKSMLEADGYYNTNIINGKEDKGIE